MHEKRGQNRKQGEIWALLCLKNNNGLDQQELAYHLHCNVSTISRQLKNLLFFHLVDFRDDNGNAEDSTKYVRRRYYSRRIYFIKTDFRDVMASSLSSIIDNSAWFKNKLEMLKDKIEQDSQENDVVRKNLLIHITDIDERIKILNNIWSKFISESKEIL